MADLIGWLFLMSVLLGTLLTYQVGVRRARRALLAERRRPAVLTYATDEAAVSAGESDAVREHHAQAMRDGARRCGCSDRCAIDHPELTPSWVRYPYSRPVPTLPDPWEPTPARRSSPKMARLSTYNGKGMGPISDVPAMAATLSDVPAVAATLGTLPSQTSDQGCSCCRRPLNPPTRPSPTRGVTR